MQDRFLRTDLATTVKTTPPLTLPGDEAPRSHFALLKQFESNCRNKML
jgi:hypothetical protein